MTRDEIVAALRCCEQHKKCEGECPLIAEFGCIEKAIFLTYEELEKALEAMKDGNS